MECSFWNMTFVINEEARFLSDWAVNYDYNFLVISCSLSISRRGNLIRTIEFDIVSMLWWPWRLLSGSDTGTLLPRWHCLPYIPMKRFLLSAPMSHLHKAPSITVLRTLQGNHLAYGSVPLWKTSRTKAMSYSHLVSEDTWHAAKSQKKIVDQHWIVKWPPNYREVECGFCLHETDCFKLTNNIKNAEEVSYLPGQISFPGLCYSAYIIEKVYI